MGIGATWFGRRSRFISGGSGGTMGSTGREGGNYMLGMDRECTRIAETVPDDVSSDDRLAPVLLGQVDRSSLGISC